MPVKSDPFKTEDNTVERNVAPVSATKSELPVKDDAEETVPQSYVWLANGSVVLANDEDLPGSAGHGSPHGHWQIGNKVHTIVGVYPIETTLESE